MDACFYQPDFIKANSYYAAQLIWPERFLVGHHIGNFNDQASETSDAEVEAVSVSSLLMCFEMRANALGRSGRLSRKEIGTTKRWVSREGAL